MDYIRDGFTEAIQLLLSFNTEIYAIIGLSIGVSILSTFFASILGVLFGIFMGLKSFRFKPYVIRVVYALMALPPVVVGLFVAIVLSRRGPMGSFQLLFSPTAMVIAQTILITPIITGLVFNATKDRGVNISQVSQTLGGTASDQFLLVIQELKKDITIAITTGFGRGISEVGAVMIVGGNIKGHTRVMTSFIAMNNSMGNYSQSIAMGIVLIGIAVIANGFIHRLSGD